MNAIFRPILDFIYNIVGSHGLSVIIFTLLIRTLLLPFDYKSRKSMRRMEKINPKVQELQKKYGNDKEKLQRKQAELYKKEKVNPLGSCLPMLLTFPILIAMFSVMRNVANEELAKMLLALMEAVGDLTDPEAVRAVLPELNVEPFLWIKNLWMADSPFASILPVGSSALAAIGSPIPGVINAEQITALKVFVDGEVYQTIVAPFYGAVKLPGASINLLITQIDIFTNPNGFFILPALSGISQFFTNSLNPQQASAQPRDPNKPNTMNFMKWFFPIFSVWICASSTASFALYWVTTNIVSMIQMVAFKKVFEMQERRASADPSREVDKL